MCVILWCFCVNRVMVKMKNLLNGNTWLWERGKFMNRRYLMQVCSHLGFQQWPGNLEIFFLPHWVAGFCGNSVTNADVAALPPTLLLRQKNNYKKTNYRKVLLLRPCRIKTMHSAFKTTFFWSELAVFSAI